MYLCKGLPATWSEVPGTLTVSCLECDGLALDSEAYLREGQISIDCGCVEASPDKALLTRIPSPTSRAPQQPQPQRSRVCPSPRGASTDSIGPRRGGAAQRGRGLGPQPALASWDGRREGHPRRQRGQLPMAGCCSLINRPPAIKQQRLRDTAQWTASREGCCPIVYSLPAIEQQFCGTLQQLVMPAYLRTLAVPVTTIRSSSAMLRTSQHGQAQPEPCSKLLPVCARRTIEVLATK